MRLSMQYFADPMEQPEQANETGETGEPETNKPVEEQNKTNYEDLYKTDKSLQSFIDSHTTKSIQTAIANEKSKWEKLRDESLSEAEKLKNLDEKGKLQYQLDKERKQREALERKLNAGTLKDETLSQMSEQGLNAEFLKLFDFERETAETVTSKISVLKTILDNAVETEVNLRLKQNPPKTVKKGAGDKKYETRNFF